MRGRHQADRDTSTKPDAATRPERYSGAIGWGHHCGTGQWENEARRFRGRLRCVTSTCNEDWDFGVWVVYEGNPEWGELDWGSCMPRHATNHDVIWQGCGDTCQLPEAHLGPR